MTRFYFPRNRGAVFGSSKTPTRALGINQPERDSDNLSPSNAEIRMMGVMPPLLIFLRAYAGRALPSLYVTLLVTLDLNVIYNLLKC